MNPKIIKIDEEHAKNDAKIAKLQERNRELEKQRMEIENTDIIGIVRGTGLTTDQLAELVRGAKAVAVSGEKAPEGIAHEEH